MGITKVYVNDWTGRLIEKRGFFLTEEEMQKTKEDIWDKAQQSVIDNSSIGYDTCQDIRFVEIDFSCIEKEKISYLKNATHE